MQEKSVRRNYIYNLSYQILLLITPLITTPYVSRVLGADGVGVFSYTNSIVSYFVMFAVLGTTIYGQRGISYVQKNEYKRSVAFWSVEVIRSFTALLSAAVYLVFCIYREENRLIYQILIINIIAVPFDVSWFFQGIEEFGKIVGRNCIFKALNIAFIYLFIKRKTDLTLYIAGTCALTMLSNLSLWTYLRKYVKKVRISELKIRTEIWTIISLFIPTVAIQVYQVLDKTMIGMITGSSFQNGFYEQAEKISKMSLTVVTSLCAVMSPRIGFFFSQGRWDEVKRYMLKSYRFVWLISFPLCFGLAAVASNLVPWFLGEGYEEVIPILRVLSMLIPIIGISNITGMQYLIPTKRQNGFTLTVTIGAGVNFILNMILISRMHAVGAAIATVAAELTITVSQIILVRKELDVLGILRAGIKYLAASGIMYLVASVEAGMLEPSFIHTIVIILSSALFYGLTLFVLKDEFFLENLKAGLKKVHLRK